MSTAQTTDTSEQALPPSSSSSSSSSKRARRALAAVLVPLIILTIVSAAILWPHHQKHPTPANLGPAAALVNGTVARVDSGPCAGDPSGDQCQTVLVHISTGQDKGHTAVLTSQQGPGQPVIKNGDKIVLGRSLDPTSGAATYYFADFQRKVPLLFFGLAFALLVVLIARWRGAGALVGLAFTWLVVTNFMLPSLLEGRAPLAVALTGAAAIVLVALYVAHGFSARTTTAVIGTLIALGLTGGLAWLSVHLAHLTGLSSEEATYVQNYAGKVDIRGLVLAGIVIGSLGVLNDMTVTQASTVWEIHLAQPLRGRRELYTSAMRVGRDHIASTVYTLVLAYTGAALPLLIVFAVANRRFGDVIGSDVVAEEIVRTLAGSIGLILSVPLTTALAAAVVKSEGTRSLAVPAEIETVAEDWEDRQAAETEAANDEAAATEHSVIDAREHHAPDEHGAPFDEDPNAPIILTPSSPRNRRAGLRRKPVTFDRKMSRRERKFWEAD